MSVLTIERELLEHAAAGRADAFGELLRRHLPCLYDFACRLLRDPDEARALIDETIADLAREPAVIALGEGFRAACLKLLIEKAIRGRRGKGALGVETIILNAPVVDACCRSSMSLQHGPEFDAGLAVLVWQVASSLDRRQFAVLDLHLRQGLSAGELAHVLGLSPTSIKATTTRMEKSVEETMRSVILSQRGRRWCSELNLALADEDRMRIDEEQRRRIGAHVESCNSCLQTATRLPSGLDVYRSLQPINPPPGLRSGVLASALPFLQADQPDAASASAQPVVSTTGRIAPLTRGLRIEGTLHPTRQAPAIHMPRFRAARVSLQGGAEDDEAYSYEYADGSRPAGRDGRRFFVIAIGLLAIVGLLGLLGLLFVTRDDGGGQDTAVAEPTLPLADAEEELELTLSATEVDFSSDQTSRLLTLETVAGDTVTWTLEGDQPWLSINPAAGSIAPGESVAIEVSVDREPLPEGQHSATIVLASSEGEQTEVPVELVVPGTGPTISDQRLNIPSDEETGALFIFKSGCEPEPTAFRVSAAIEDPSGVERAALIYIVGADEPLTIEMTESQGRWEGSIPPLTRDGPVVFHIEAVDSAENLTASQPVTVELRDCASSDATPGA